MATTIEHKGIVVGIVENIVKVNILAQSACSACHAKGACNVSDVEEKQIEILSNQNFTIGENVNVIMQKALGFKALIYGYLIPFIFVLLALIVSSAITENEAISGIISLLVLIPYYLVLFLLRNRFKKEFSFKISKL